MTTMKNMKTLLIALALTLSLTDAGAITFNTNTAIGNGNTTYDGQDITVSGCTLTVDGPHNFASLAVTNGGVLTHSAAPNGEANNRLDLTITGDVTVDATSAIQANGRGYGPDSGPGAGVPSNSGGGAGHGGIGGARRARSERGSSYGSLTHPVDLGSGGSSSGGVSGGSGGGAITLTVAGTLVLDGSISANGINGNSSYYGGGGGSGGSVMLTCGVLSGSGAISANGGSSGSSSENGPGGGGGGRIALYFNGKTFTGSMTAWGKTGSSGGEPGGAGTVYLKPADVAGQLIVDNGALAAGRTPIASPVSFSLVIRNGAVAYPESSLNLLGMTIASNGVLMHLSGAKGTSVAVDGDATIEAGGAINLDGRGYGPASGPGAGVPSNSGGGAGHGGLGGARGSRSERGATYGSLTNPADLGSGGSSCGGISGGSGGGAIMLTVAGTLGLDGSISANGTSGASSYYGGGGGSGGSVLLTCGTLAGTGTISANGGSSGTSSENQPGGGSGGRIAVFFNGKTFTGTMTAWGKSGSSGGEPGGAGTVYVKPAAVAGQLIVDNGSLEANWTPISSVEVCDLTIGAGCWVNPNTSVILSALRIKSGGRLSHQGGVFGTQVTVLGDATIETGASIMLNGQGYGAGSGPGAGPLTYGAGAGHGGLGGRARYHGERGAIYDSLSHPVELGSGGSSSGGVSGGPGGGAITLTVAGTLVLDGNISANGINGNSSYYGGGGGSGGSVLLTCGVLSGSGTIDANGGAAYSNENGPGGGGGGRIALYCADRTGFNVGHITANGGYGTGEYGQNGTIYISNLTPWILAQTPSGTVDSAVDQVDVTFDVPVNGATFTGADVVLTTPTGTVDPALISVGKVAGQTWRIGFPAQSALGNYSIQIGPHIQDLAGLEMRMAYSGGFGIQGLQISGVVRAVNGAPLSGVLVRADAERTATTVANGGYTLIVPPGWTGQVVPTKSGCVFSPGSRAYTSLAAGVANANFALAPASQ
ncbi:MAG: hypothetical protein NTW21_34680, partial [Verrucomicrobia bacterium]|nr:hypothetical protein [Verrucomicrobiota bacterium]